MSSPQKKLLTVYLPYNDESLHLWEKLLIPFPPEKTCGDLLKEIQRRAGPASDSLQALRVRSMDGPRLFEDDLVEDIIHEASTFYAVPETPIAMSPMHGQSLSPPAVMPWLASLPEEDKVFKGQPPPPPCLDDGMGRFEQPAMEPACVGWDGSSPVKNRCHVPHVPSEKQEEHGFEDGFEQPSLEPACVGWDGSSPVKSRCHVPLPNDEPEACDAGSGGESEEEAGMWYFTPPIRGSRQPQSAAKSPVRATHMRHPVAELGNPEKPLGSSKAGEMGGEGERYVAPGSTIELLSDRRVEWVIHGIGEKLLAYPKGMRMFSPEFAAFGIDKLGLVLYPNGNSNAKLGFCSLGLKAPHGAHLRYKLYVAQTEKYTELRQNVTESWGFVDMCRVEDECDRETDTLRVGVEIIDDIDVNEELVEVTPTKIEWVLRNMESKLKYYRKDIALYSAEFSAAGVDKLRLKLYPSGKKEADDGWCSLYLEAPKGSELRCRLSVGSKSMSFDRLEKFGEDSIWGFLILCKLEEELVQRETQEVRVALEVLETKRLDQCITEVEDQYLKSLSTEKRAWLLDELQRVEKVRNGADAGGVPSRFRILMMQLPDSAKAVALQRLESLNTDLMSAEATKLKRWIDGVLSLPFGKLERPLVSLGQGNAVVRTYLDKAEAALHASVFGHDEPKEKIVQVLCQWISNPDSQSLVLGIQGPPGNGKTTLCRKGIAEALERPFAQISLGGATDASVLEGHSYTYVGSAWGRIAGLLMETQCMNPIIFFDELDKVSETPRGEEIYGVLTHLTDGSQNSNYTDRYFDGIPLDMSKAMFIFSFNDESKIHPVLRDRLTIIKTKGFGMVEKHKIAQKFLLPDLLRNVGMETTDVLLQDGSQGVADMAWLQEHWEGKQSAEQGGVRGLKQALEATVLHLNKLRVLSVDTPAKASAESEPEARAASAPRDQAQPVAGPPVGPPRNGKAVCESRQAEADGASKPRSGADGPEDACIVSKAAIDVSFPLTLTRELMEKLLPEHDPKPTHALMYI